MASTLNLSGTNFGPIGSDNGSGGIAIPQIKTSSVQPLINNGYVAPAPTPKQQVLSTTSTQPQAKTAPTGGTNYQNGGWYGGKYYWNGQFYSSPNDVNQQASSSPSEPSINFDEIYAPQFAALDEAERSAQENADSLGGDVLIGKNQALRDIDTQSAEANLTFDTSEKKALQQKSSAMEEAVRAYQAMAQRARAGYGRGSSAGQAIGELANREYFRNTGNAETAYADVFDNILQKRHAAELAFSQAKIKVDENTQLQLSAIKRQLNDQLSSIKQARFQVESDKTAKRMEVVDRAIQEAKAVKQAHQQQLEALNIWKAQVDYQNGLLKGNYQGYQAPSAQYTQQNSSIASQTPTSSSPISGIRWNPNTRQFEDDTLI